MTKYISVLKSKSILLLLVIILFGSILRLYNISFDNLWIDEISTFWIANPNISNIESYNNHKSLEQTPFLFNYIIKLYFEIFGYNENISRLIPAISSILSIFVIIKISKLLDKNNAYIFSAFIVSFNIFLISYAQELRVYSSFFLFNCLSIFYFFKCYQSNNLFYYLIFFILNLFTISLHPFSFILLSSYFLYLFFLFLKKKIDHKVYVVLFFSLVFFCVYYYIGSINSLNTPSWIGQPDFKFYTNYYFSKFFGSRILGLIHLIILILLLIYFFKRREKKDFHIFFIIFLILCYMIPLLYGFIFKPIILPRYIIFVLIPITFLLSHLIYEIRNRLSIFIVGFICFITIGNLFTEQVFKQFFEGRKIYKPELNKAINFINNSKNNFYFIKTNLVQTEIEEPFKKAVENYVQYLSSNNNYDLEKVQDPTKNKNFWIICFYDLNQGNCSIDTYEVTMEISFNRLVIKLVNW
tara:strand:- start:39 stop:1442 length:1404 start_codon:yes stop_codon:yes gene_type:complete